MTCGRALRLCVLALLVVLSPSFVAAELRAGGRFGAPLPPQNPSLVLFVGLLGPWGLQPDPPMRLKGGAGDENIKTGESKPKAKGKNGKPLSKYNQFMQIEVPRVRASDSSLTHAQAFSVPPSSAARKNAPGRQRNGSSKMRCCPFARVSGSTFASFSPTSMQLRALAAQTSRTRASARAQKARYRLLVLPVWTPTSTHFCARPACSLTPQCCGRRRPNTGAPRAKKRRRHGRRDPQAQAQAQALVLALAGLSIQVPMSLEAS